jgi:tungstate transport system substrate-binding protein
MEVGHGQGRFLVMHNDLIIVGPASDPACIKGMATADEAITTIFNAGKDPAELGLDS